MEHFFRSRFSISQSVTNGGGTDALGSLRCGDDPEPILMLPQEGVLLQPCFRIVSIPLDHKDLKPVQKFPDPVPPGDHGNFIATSQKIQLCICYCSMDHLFVFDFQMVSFSGSLQTLLLLIRVYSTFHISVRVSKSRRDNMQQLHGDTSIVCADPCQKACHRQM